MRIDLLPNGSVAPEQKSPSLAGEVPVVQPVEDDGFRLPSFRSAHLQCNFSNHIAGHRARFQEPVARHNPPHRRRT